MDIDLLISDVVMPKMGGVTLANLLQQRMPHIKILFISGYPNNAVVASSILEKGKAFMQKPFSPDDLTFKVRKVLDS